MLTFLAFFSSLRKWEKYNKINVEDMWMNRWLYIMISASSWFLIASKSGRSRFFNSSWSFLPTSSDLRMFYLMFREFKNCCICSLSFSLFSLASCNCLLLGWIGGFWLRNLFHFMSEIKENNMNVEMKFLLVFAAFTFKKRMVFYVSCSICSKTLLVV